MVLSSGGQYEMTQTLQDGVTATYENILVVSGTPSALLGVYLCSILNEIGTVTRNITINGECSACLSWLATSSIPFLCNICPSNHLFLPLTCLPCTLLYISCDPFSV